MNYVTYNHNLGVLAIKKETIEPLLQGLDTIQFKIERRCASDLRKTVERLIQLQGWSGKIKIDKSRGITITSMKNNIGLCFQTGNVGRFYADILKLQTLYLNGKAEAGIFILPTKHAALMMGDNLANFERCIQELDLYKKTITIPIYVIGIES